MTGPFPPGFQWDEAKNRANIAKHGLDFRDAVRVFEKPTLDREDNSLPYGEVRTNSLGDLDGQVIVNVTHTDRNGDIRLISARRADPAERRAYLEFQLSLQPDRSPSPWPDYSRGIELKKTDK